MLAAGVIGHKGEFILRATVAAIVVFTPLLPPCGREAHGVPKPLQLATSLQTVAKVVPP